MNTAFPCLLAIFSAVHFSSCVEKKEPVSKASIATLALKRGEVISCGPADKEFGSLEFSFAGNEKVKDDLTMGLKLLHSFEYDEAEKIFAKVIDAQPDCAIAYWGVAMANFHPLWTPPTPAELQKGAAALEIARSIKKSDEKEADYINALRAFYNNHEKDNHRTRTIRFEQAMEDLHKKYKDDKEAAILYSLALTAAADPKDKTYTRQKKAGQILNGLYPTEQNHPGVVHYLIHTFDYPELAELGLPAARKYASIAPSSAHALHMPSHIFTRLGLWNESIKSNLASVSSAQCYAQQAGIRGHWDEEIHGLDYLVYAYLQKGQNQKANELLKYVKSFESVHPQNFKVSYSFAAIPSRIFLENKNWKEAANIEPLFREFPWHEHPWQKAIVHFTRVLGNVNIGNTEKAKAELEELKKLYSRLSDQKKVYEADQVDVQVKAADAWISFKEGRMQDAETFMSAAADLEDNTGKHPVTPGEVVPARELYAELLLQMNKPGKALEEFERAVKKAPYRFNGLYGAGLAAEKSGNIEKAKFYFRQLLTVAGENNTERPELAYAKKVLGPQTSLAQVR